MATKILFIFLGFYFTTVKIHKGLDNFSAKDPVITIGTFDGVHLGHRKVIGRLKEIASENNGESVLFTFFPHPRLIVSPGEKNLRLITTLDEKQDILASLGVDHLIVFPFNKKFSETPYEKFVKNIIVGKIRARYLVMGYDHRFGRSREGDFKYMKKCADKFNFKIEKLDALLLNHINISSSKIRSSLEQGNIEVSNKYLGYNFTLHGKVVEGRKMGRTFGFPTANIESSDIHKIIPGYGVYAVKIRFNGSWYKGMLNIGSRPTFNNNADNRSIEVNIFDFNKNIYGKQITLEFIKRIRAEQKFASKEGLIKQLYIDKRAAISLLRGV